MVFNLHTTRPTIKNHGKVAVSLKNGRAMTFDASGSGPVKAVLHRVQVDDISADCIQISGYEERSRGFIFQEWILK